MRSQPGVHAVVLGGSPEEGKVTLVAAVEPGHGLEAPQLVATAARMVGGGGGGRNPELAMAGGPRRQSAWTRPWRPSGAKARARSAAVTGPATAIVHEGRVLGVDLGSRRIGLAVSDSDRTVASALTVLIRGATHAEDHARLASVLAETGANLVVVGLPLSLSGRAGPAAQRV